MTTKKKKPTKTKLAGKEIIKRRRKLNIRQEKFCRLFVSDTEFFGNGVQSYVEVYKPKKVGNWYKSACSTVSMMLRNIKLCNRINELLSEKGLNDENVDKQTLFLVNQFSDFSNKLGAIREYNKIKKRTDEKKEESTVHIENINYIIPKDEHNPPANIKTTPSVPTAE